MHSALTALALFGLVSCRAWVDYAPAPDAGMSKGGEPVSDSVSWEASGRDVSWMDRSRVDSIDQSVERSRDDVAAADSVPMGPWSLTLDGAYTPAPTKVAMASDGSIYLAFRFEGTIDSCGPHISKGRDILLAKVRVDGSIAWCRKVGGPDLDDLGGLAVDTAQTIWVAGSFRAQLAPQHVSMGGDDIFLMAFDAAGQQTAVHTFGGSTQDTVRALVSGADGSLYMAAQLATGATVGPWKATTTGDHVVAFRPSATFAWAKTLLEKGRFARVTDMALDETALYLTGFFQDATIWGQPRNSQGSTDTFITALNDVHSAAPLASWIATISGDTAIEESVIDARDGQVVVATNFYGSATLGSMSYTSLGLRDVALVKLSAAGRVQSHAHIKSSNHLTKGDVLITDNGGVLLTANSRGKATCGGRSVVLAPSDGGPWGDYADGILVSLGGDLVCTGIQSWSSRGTDQLTSIRVHLGRQIAAGTFTGDITLPGAAHSTLPSARQVFLFSR